MDNEDLIKNIALYQRCGFVHPLTCGREDCRADLIGVEEEGNVVLYCPHCGYVQRWIPDGVRGIHINIRSLIAATERDEDAARFPITSPYNNLKRLMWEVYGEH